MLMTGNLSKQYDVDDLSSKHQVISGQVPVRCFKRLDEVLADKEGSLDVHLSFDAINEQVIRCQGKMTGQLSLVCQRSLESFPFEVDHTFTMALSDNLALLKTLEEEYAPFLFDGCTIAPIDLVEEEVLMLLPLVPKKPFRDCKLDKNSAYYQAVSDAGSVQTDRPNPFAVLAELKKKH